MEKPNGQEGQTQLDFLKSRYDIEIGLHQKSKRQIAVLGIGRSISYDTLPSKNTPPFIDAIRRDLSLYPPSFIRSLGLKRIELVQNLSESSWGANIPEVGGIPVPKKGLLFLEIKNVLSGGLHHEISHFLDREISGFRGRKKRQEWVQLNPQGSKAYKPTEEYFTNRELDHERPPGFASFYGTFSPKEDRAEILQLVMRFAAPDSVPNYLIEMMKKDEVVRKKIMYMLDEVRRKSAESVGENYFQDLINKRVNEDYWNEKR